MTRKIITTDIAVESRNRSLTLYPNAYDYSVSLERVARGVVSFNISSVIIKKSYTAVNKFNMYMDYQENGYQPQTMIIPIGDYTEDSILETIETYLNDNTQSGATYTIYRDSTTELVTFSISGGTTNFLFNSGSNSAYGIYTNLGFSVKDTGYISLVSASFRVDLDPSYVDLIIKEIPIIASKKTLRYTRNLNDWTGHPQLVELDVVARIPLDNEDETRKYYSAKETDFTNVYFKPMDFPKLSIQFIDNFGKFYDPGEHTIQFQITMLRDNLSRYQLDNTLVKPKKEITQTIVYKQDTDALKESIVASSEKTCKAIKVLTVIIVLAIAVIILATLGLVYSPKNLQSRRISM